ncbi:hypothetical protein JMJ77_0002780 [Colletotrichum scovillei]|uniref:Uncharacterized protein n=1 Tax=Colletotrichum scovillei TaxID=1209932 RepID=A0A9P7QWR6_9PEZI|nr:hypothetical protein JMJ78_0005994 [Colletotrichum scovillei]KAG7043068.1 hypothetical protein JMJ77_0002780 [Colletotrichum scovillei]KAG7062515.1 hypothetical protein JMJ76_0009364 [Colletotrichum scovillei]
MKFSVALLALRATSFTMAAPFQSEENVSLKPRNEIFARKVCWVENGMSCYYGDDVCYYHSCWNCKCKATYWGRELKRRNCTNKIDTDCNWL